MLEPRFSVDMKKRENIIDTSNRFLDKYKTDLTIRYDISEVTYDKSGKMKINYIKNAF